MRRLTPPAAEALQRLRTGNERYRSGAPMTPPETFSQFEAGQAPYAAVLSCADSRVPPEWIFSAGLGELFVVRVAGNVATPTQIGSLEYAVAQLNCPLILVMGHSHCGAVAAAQGDLSDLPENLYPLMDEITASLSEPRTEGRSAEEVNARYAAEMLPKRSSLLEQYLKSGALSIASATYHLGTGTVELHTDTGPGANPSI